MATLKRRKTPEKGSSQLRKGRCSREGYLYFVTASCFAKQRIFVERDTVEIVFGAIDWLENRGHIDCYFAIVMPNHLHLILQLFSKKTLSEAMRSLKGFTGRRIKRHLGLHTLVWQDGFYDHAIRKDEDIVKIMKYCLHNPVRAGLVEDAFEYPYWKCKYDLRE